MRSPCGQPAGARVAKSIAALQAWEQLEAEDLAVGRAERVDAGEALVDLHPAEIALPPQPKVYDEAPATGVEDLDRLHPETGPGL